MREALLDDVVLEAFWRTGPAAYNDMTLFATLHAALRTRSLSPDCRYEISRLLCADRLDPSAPWRRHALELRLALRKFIMKRDLRVRA